MAEVELDRVASALGRVLRTADAPPARSGGSSAAGALPENVGACDPADELGPEAPATAGPGAIPLDLLVQRVGAELGREVDEDLLLRTASRGRAFSVCELPDGQHGIALAERAGDRGRDGSAGAPPDILYHACTAAQVEAYKAAGVLRLASGRAVFLSDDEAQAWRAAHRMDGEPRVLYVDTARHRRKRLHLPRNRRGLYLARSVALADVLNLRPDFAEQLSAGGIPVTRGPDGEPRMALIRVTRRSGVTWEVAKGKLEPGEPPEWAGVREVREEMGVDVDFDVRGLVGHVRYGFLAPGGLPRLKTVYLYLLSPRGEMADRFSPAHAEGIRDVRWFTLEEACRVVTHSSLRPLMRKAREMAEAW